MHPGGTVQPASPSELGSQRRQEAGVQPIDSISQAKLSTSGKSQSGLQTELQTGQHTTLPQQEVVPQANIESGTLSPPLERLENSTDLQFKKKDYQRSRTLSFQSVLSSASLKSLKHQYTTPKPALERNASNLLQHGIKNFQSYIQAPVLLLVTSARRDDDIVIGQRLPFDVNSSTGPETATSTHNAPQTQRSNAYDTEDSSQAPDTASSNSDDIYKEETTLQQQKLTLNALKKLSLSLAPIIHTEDEDEGIMSRGGSSLQISSRPLNSRTLATNLTARVVAQNQHVNLQLHPSNVTHKRTAKGSKPYLPAEVDLSQFSSLTRQTRVTPSEENPPVLEKLDAKPIQNVDVESEPVKSTALDSASNIPVKDVKSPDSIVAPNTFKVAEGTKPAQSAENTRTSSSNHHNINPSSHSHNMHDHKDRPDLRIDLSKLPNHAETLSAMHAAHPNSQSSGYPAIGARNPLTDLYVGRGNSDAGKTVPQQAQNRVLPLKKLQQINGFRSPMYIPAVLRKTETAADDDDDKDVSRENFFIPDGAGISSGGFNAGVGSKLTPSATTPLSASMSVSSTGLVRSTDLVSGGNMQNGGLGADSTEEYGLKTQQFKTSYSQTGPYSLHPTSSNSRSRLNSNGAMNSNPKLNYAQYHLHIINAPPTRHHWLRDESVVECGIASCKKKFNFFERRHHCRKCGGIFCKEHTLNFLYINHLAQFTLGGRGTLSRVCMNCVLEYRQLASKAASGVHNGQNGINKGAGAGAHNSNAIGTSAHNNNSINNGNGAQTAGKDMFNMASPADESQKDTLVGSVPANWSWSSF